jgi:protein-disulfide isomerase
MEEPKPAENTPRPSAFGQLGVLLLGMVIGGALVAGLISSGIVRTGPQTPPAPAVDLDAVRAAARDGAATAIAQQPARPAAPAAVDAQPGAQAAQPGQVFNVSVRGANSVGAESAPVTIVEYSDFECGFCQRFYSSTLKELDEEFIKTGKVRFSYKHYPFLAASSLPKALAAECAAEQGKFWEMHSALFQGAIARGADEATIRTQGASLVASFGGDAAAFGACLDNPATRERVMADASEGQSVGVQGTPTFLVNGRPLVGAQPITAFRASIEQALANP